MVGEDSGPGGDSGGSPLARAVEWVARITTVALVMVLPGVAGWWLDKRLQTRFLVAIGFGLGLALGLVYLLSLSGVQGRRSNGDGGKQA